MAFRRLRPKTGTFCNIWAENSPQDTLPLQKRPPLLRRDLVLHTLHRIRVSPSRSYRCRSILKQPVNEQLFLITNGLVGNDSFPLTVLIYLDIVTLVKIFIFLLAVMQTSFAPSVTFAVKGIVLMTSVGLCADKSNYCLTIIHNNCCST